MLDARLLSWPIWISFGVHAVGLAAASSVVVVARHNAETVLVPVEMVRIEPPSIPPKLKLPRLVAKPSPVVRSAPATQTLMPDPTPARERAPDHDHRAESARGHEPDPRAASVRGAGADHQA
ncbi:MAG TPA: hypothetical protein VJX92_00740, partial [Methylomirabilota bacterium]|nr:hypothetical protein [Methylomirabilota bacterium]